MPSASDLRELCSADSLLEVTVVNVEQAAKFGDTSHTLEIPPAMSLSVMKKRLAKEFPGCRIVQKWFTRRIEIRWT